MGKGLEYFFSKKNMKMTNEYMKKCSYHKTSVLPGIFWLTFASLFLGARFCIKYFTMITLVNLHNKSLQSILILAPFLIYKSENRGTESLWFNQNYMANKWYSTTSKLKGLHLEFIHITTLLYFTNINNLGYYCCRIGPIPIYYEWLLQKDLEGNWRH